MKRNVAKKTLIISAIVLFGGAALAFAQGGYYGGYGGYGGHMMGYGHMGYGPGYMMGNGPMGYGPGYMMGDDGYGPPMRRNGYYGANLSQEDLAKLDAARNKFFDETQDLREQIDQKRFDLSRELSKQQPDAAKAAKLQKELSQLESQFDQIALQHRLEMRKLLPENARGRGYGRGYGHRGSCW
ncbi:MAG: periplasmic heavy metal sensor [Desulfosarcinaceae bacterium]